MSRQAFDLYGLEFYADNGLQFDNAKNWLERITAGLCKTAKKRLTREYVDRNNREQITANGHINQHRSANIHARKLARQFHQMQDSKLLKSLKSVYGDKALYVENCHDWALVMAEECRDIAALYGEPTAENLPEIAEKVCKHIRAQGVEPPRIETDHEFSALLKAIAPQWWERKGNVAARQMREHWEIALGEVKAGKSLYVSKDLLQWSKDQKTANENFLQSLELVNEAGDVIDLYEMWQKSSAHPDKRRIELMVRIRGLQDLAKADNWGCDFVTWTAPSKYHATSRKYSGATPRQTNNYLCKQWQKCRDKFIRAGIEWFGVRVVEPHQDATPHWHLLTFFPKSQRQQARAIMQKYALQHDAEEKGARRNRITFEYIDLDSPNGGAVGYIAKYIAKNINAKNVEFEASDEDPNTTLKDNAERVAAWASGWKLRQFQFFGCAAVTTYRELRRYSENLPEAVRELWDAADLHDWSAFQRLFNEYRPKLIKEKAPLNDYAEFSERIIGVEVLGFRLLTRVSEWSKRAKRDDSRATWSTVTNYAATKNKQFFLSAEQWNEVGELSYSDRIRRKLGDVFSQKIDGLTA
ncbi:replication endonuclease [Idiomarina seosinensis]|uniref:replication endonuclease n=1 Tax=Idiomarina seosinensis TaxID=281739 RepID=UPI00384BF406